MHSGTESVSSYHSLDQLSIGNILKVINEEDKTVPVSVEKALPQLEKLAEKVFLQMQNGGKLFYIGAGTSGRLGIVDASECPPTYGVPHGLVIGLIAGGDAAIRKAVENAEDDWNAAKTDLLAHQVSTRDIVIGIAASGRTPYVAGGLQWARTQGIPTGCIVCNLNSIVAENADYPVEILVGPEVITGSTRMKAGTAQKLALNMITTTVMVRLGKVRGNRMTHMQLSNEKLRNRAMEMVMDLGKVDSEAAKALLEKWGNVERVLQFLEENNNNARTGTI